jgi:4-amino-4-deoxy-L-arabinose transferase-like glycosyltransferase
VGGNETVTSSALVARVRARPEGAAIMALTALALTLRVARLADQPLIGDDLAVADSAMGFLATGWPGPTMWNHPRLRDLLVYVSVQALGEGPWAIRSWSILFGTLSVPATFWMVRTLGGGLLAAGLAGLLLAVDPLHVGFSRQGINDVYLAFFGPALVVATWRYRRSRRSAWLLVAGALLGLGLATKVGIAFVAAACAAALAVDVLAGPAPAPTRAREAAAALACVGLLALGIYVATFAPWFGRGHDLAEWVTFQLRMAHETATHTGYPGTKLPDYLGEVVGAWRWFLQPIYYTATSAVPVVVGTNARAVPLAWIANPIACLTVWPAFALALHLAWRARDRTSAWLAALFAAAYVPFVVVPRPIWTNSAVAVLPFALALVGHAGAQVWRWRPHLAAIWVGACVALALALWLPAVGWSTLPSDWIMTRLVPPEAFLR